MFINPELQVPAPINGHSKDAGIYTPRIQALRQIELNRRTENIVLRILKSPLFWAALSMSLLAAFTAAVIVGAVVLPPFSFGSIAIISALAITIFFKNNEHKIWFELSLLCIRIESAWTALKRELPAIARRNWYDEIRLFSEQDGIGRLYLGAIPLASMGHHREILSLSAERKFSVLTILQPFENHESGLIGDPVRPQDWAHLEVNHKQIPIFDLQPIATDKIHEGADFIHQSLQNGHVYVHCKAGRGRSAMEVIGYLMKYHKEKIEQREGSDFVQKAISSVRESRPQIYLSPKQLESLYAYSATLQEVPLESIA